MTRNGDAFQCLKKKFGRVKAYAKLKAGILLDMKLTWTDLIRDNIQDKYESTCACCLGCICAMLF